MYDSVSMTAFGPVTREEKLRGFLLWLDNRGERDPRSIPDGRLVEFYNLFVDDRDWITEDGDLTPHAEELLFSAGA
jgi:hypothetical protein